MRLVTPLMLAAALLGGIGTSDSLGSEGPGAGRVYVLVHGAWGGGWDWQGMERRLENAGATVYRVTLTGHGEKVHLASPAVDLSTHVMDVVNVLRWEGLEEVALVGHSYGGMVITGVADEAPERIQKLVYLDAIVPEDGESVNSAFGRASTDTTGPGEAKDGFSVPPWVPEGAEPPHDVPHSLACFTEAIELENPERMEIDTLYLYYIDPGLEVEEDGFYRFYQRAREYGWETVALKGWDHNAHRTRPEELMGYLLDLGD